MFALIVAHAIHVALPVLHHANAHEHRKIEI